MDHLLTPSPGWIVMRVQTPALPLLRMTVCTREREFVGGVICRGLGVWLSVLFTTIFPQQKQTNLPLATLGASKVAASGPNSGWTTERLSSTSTRPRRSVIFIEPWTRIVRRWGDPRRLLLLTNALLQQQCQQLHHLHLQKQLVPNLDCICWCWFFD